MSIKCTCGKNMTLKRAADCYPNSTSSGKVRCDECNGSFSGSRLIFNCPKNPTHPGGRDICKECVLKQGSANAPGDNEDSLFSTFRQLNVQQERPKKTLMCSCGVALKLTSSSKCYDGQRVWCDLCNEDIKEPAKVYHCPRGQTAPHVGGYDLCTLCGDNLSVATKVTSVLREHLEAYKRAHAEQKRQIAQLQVFAVHGDYVMDCCHGDIWMMA